MTKWRVPPVIAVVAIGALTLGGCGSSSSKPQAGGGKSEAKSAATGDIPDNQVFLTYRDRGAGYSLSYPEGWTRHGAGRRISFSDKDNSVDLKIATTRVRLRHGRAIKTTYSHVGPPNPVTAKRPLLMVDRYVYPHGREAATLDLSTPKGVDNVDAYRLIARSFRWN
jgi:hypothetical protein